MEKMKNLGKEYIKIAKIFIESFKRDKNIVGITLNGGIPRGTGDKYSEIDISFYVKDKDKLKEPPSAGDLLVNGVWFDFSIIEIKEKKEEEWDIQERWDCKNSKILFERDGAITKLFREKVVFYDGEKKKLKERLRMTKIWCIMLAEIFIERGDLINAHLLINESLNRFIDYYFLENNQFIPHFKWKFYYFQRLRKPSGNLKKKILDGYIIKDYSEKELRRRINFIKKAIIGEKVVDEFYSYWYQDSDAIRKFSESLKKEKKYKIPWK